jgi:hypothetical protein
MFNPALPEATMAGSFMTSREKARLWHRLPASLSPKTTGFEEASGSLPTGIDMSQPINQMLVEFTRFRACSGRV